jgi:hypothetical protein
MTFDHRTVAQVIEELRRHAVIAYVESGMGEERSIVGILAFP